MVLSNMYVRWRLLVSEHFFWHHAMRPALLVFMTTAQPAITCGFERASSSAFMAYADGIWENIIPKVIVLTLLGMACNALGGWLHKRKIQRHEKDLLGSGFPPELASQVALLLVEDRLEEATVLLRKAKAARAAGAGRVGNRSEGIKWQDVWLTAEPGSPCAAARCLRCNSSL